jgi:RimJ/RimL family protein N-acetyltransferase
MFDQARYRPREGATGPELLQATRANLPDFVDLAAAHGHDPAAMERAFLRDLADLERPVLLAMVGGKVVGYGRISRFEPPPDAPPDIAPAGYYLSGLLIAESHRRRRLGRALTQARLAWIFQRASEAYYFTNARNEASIALHAQLGFVELTRDFTFPGVTFEGDSGLLGRTEAGPR